MSVPFWMLLVASGLGFAAYIRHVFLVGHKEDALVDIFAIASLSLTLYVGFLLAGAVV